jgi:hypothetical protein
MAKANVILGTLCLALGATVVAQWIQLHRMETPIIAGTAKPLIEPASELSTLVEEIPAPAGASRGGADAPPDSPTASSERAVAPETTAADSAFRTAMIDYQAIALRQQYAPFIASLRLSAEQADRFVRVLAEQRESVVAERVPSDYTEASWGAGKDDDLREVLTQAQIDAFRHYQQTTETRQQVEALRNELMVSAEPLRDAQIAPLIDALHSEEMRFFTETRDRRAAMEKPEDTEEAQRESEASFLELESAALDRKLAAGRTILSRDQVQALERQLQAQRALGIAGSKVIRLERERQLQ